MRRDPFDLSPLYGNSLHVGRAKPFGGHFAPQLPLVSTPVARWLGDIVRPILPVLAQLSVAQHREGSTGRKRAVKGGSEALALSNLSSGGKKKKKKALQLVIWRGDSSALSPAVRG